MFVLKVTEGPDRGRKVKLEPGKTYIIGSDEDSDVVLSDPMVLKGHCSLEVGDTVCILRNQTASAGTYVGDKKVSQAKLGKHSSFRVGDTMVTLFGIQVPRRGARQGPDALLGKVLGGYKLNEVVGEGGMGKVYRATQLSLHRDVALKVLRDELAKDETFRELFIHEARAAAQLIHPNVVQVFDGGTEGDVVFFSMEFIGQGSVEEVLARDTKIPWEQAILMVLEAAHGLEYAEGRSIVHRDIKPDNLMINDDGQVKIADLGLAKRGEGTKKKGIIGTPHFIPPEQALGREVDNRADIYSLGATFFRMITGRTLFSGQTAKEIVLKHIKEPAPAASSYEASVPDELDAVLSKMLAKEPDRRYQTARELIEALESVCAHHGIKGSIIKKGVGKRVLIPLILLLIGAGYAVYHFAMKEPVEVESEETKQARLKAEAEAKRRLKKQLEAQKNERRSKAEARAGRYTSNELRLTINNPISSVYDDVDKAPEREAEWKSLADELEEWSKHELAREFESESQYSSLALQRAQKIREQLKNLDASATDKREKIALMVKKAKDTNKKLQDKLGDLRLGHAYEEAVNLCELVETGQPRKEDPFGEVVGWEWVSPVDSSLRQAATEIEQIKNVVAEARKDFGKERPKILSEAKKVTDKWLAKVKELPETAADEEYTKLIEELDKLVGSFIQDSPGVKHVPQIHRHAGAMRKERDRLKQQLARRRAERFAADRVRVRNKQRAICSLDTEQIPNLVMQCDFKSAIDEWNKLLENNEIRTERYQRFVRERVQMLRWCEYLFARFHDDLKNGNLGSLDLGDLEFPDKVLKGVKLEKVQKGGPYEITINRSYKRQKTLKIASFPMHWVLHRLFLHDGKPRWKEPAPAVRFALAAFCFETMQYKAAQQQFEALLKANGGRYEKVATEMAERAARERAAREDWEALCHGVENAKTTADLKELRNRMLGFGKVHAGTIFLLEVQGRRRDAVRHDFYELDWPEIPKAPPPPDPGGPDK
ncbi:MAG: protein kinase domain-containing protein [Planctomycetota bacterium]